MFNTVSNLSMSNNNMNQTVGNMRLRYWHGFFRMIKSTVLRLYLFVLLVLLCASVRYVRIEKNLTSFLPTYLSIYLRIYLSIYLSINLFFSLSICQSIYLSIYRPINISMRYVTRSMVKGEIKKKAQKTLYFILSLSQWCWNASCQWCDLPLSQSVNQLFRL